MLVRNEDQDADRDSWDTGRGVKLVDVELVIEGADNLPFRGTNIRLARVWLEVIIIPQEFDPAAFRGRGPYRIEGSPVQLVFRCGITLNEVVILEVGCSTIHSCGILLEHIVFLEVHLTAELHLTCNRAKV